jgi:flagellar M-ring protein FliF
MTRTSAAATWVSRCPVGNNCQAPTHCPYCVEGSEYRPADRDIPFPAAVARQAARKAARQAAKQAAEAAAAAKKASLTSMIKVGVIVLAVLAALFLLWRSARKARASTTVLEPLGPMDALGALSVPALSGEPTGQLPAVPVDVAASAEAASVNSFIDAQPEEVATMLRGWLSERKGAATP